MTATFAARMEQAATPPEVDAAGRSLGIGVVGCGAIVQNAHLPAYRKAGFDVVAVADVDAERAKAVAGRFDVTAAYTSADELLADPRVRVVDIAVAPEHQREIALAAFASGRHTLCQKPLAEDFTIASELVEAARSAGVVLAVNQQMRWEPLIRGMRALIDRGDLGDVLDVSIDIDMRTDWHDWPWMARRDRLELFYHSIHHLDSVRFLLGDPEALWCSTARHRQQDTGGEARSHTVLEYTDDIRASVRTYHSPWTAHARALVHVRGTDGQADGELGLLYDYPHGRADSITFVPRDGEPQHHTFSRAWVPDAFIATMADLLRSAATGDEPATSGRDNLGTLRLVHAAYRSAAEGRRVAPAEVKA